MSDEHQTGHWMWLDEAQARALVAKDPEMIQSVIEMARCMVDWEYNWAKIAADRAAQDFELSQEPKKRARLRS